MRFIGLPGKTIGPTSVTPKGVTPCSSGMTATGSHGYFYSLRGAQPQGEGLRFVGNLPGIRRAGRAAAPTLRNDTAYRPSSGPALFCLQPIRIFPSFPGYNASEGPTRVPGAPVKADRTSMVSPCSLASSTLRSWSTCAPPSMRASMAS